jgi:FKBP-type peptidyl-prolyl cis-trans isomerase
MPHLVRRAILATFIALAFVGCEEGPETNVATEASFDSDRARASYMVGLDLAETLKPLRDEVDIDTVVAALRTAHAGQPPLLTPEQTDAARKQFSAHLRARRDAERQALATTNRARGDAFLARNGQRAEVHTTASGLQYEVLVAAEGTPPAPTDTVRVHYIGKHLDGSEFENTYSTDHPAEFVLNQVMPGWIEGIGLMPIGSKYRFWLPPTLAFGEFGLRDQVAPNETLVYEIELLEIAGR